MPPSSLRVMAAASLATTLAALPVFLVGGLAVFLRPELGIAETEIGAGATAYFATSALVSVPAGHAAERLGARPTTLAGAGCAVLSLLGIAVLAHSFLVLMLFLVVGGASNALCQIGSNAALAEGVPLRRQGLGYAVKQTAVPTATLLSGLAVPAIGLTIGWRWAFALGAVTALAYLVVAPPEPRKAGPGLRRATPERDVPMRSLVIIGIGAGCASGSAGALGAFLVQSAVAMGEPAGRAGLLLSLGSVVGIVARLGGGWLADRRVGAHLPGVSLPLLGGAIGLLQLSTGARPLLVVGTILGFGLGWSWPGVLTFAVVRLNPSAPAAATSVSQAGVFAGGAVGPLGFGLLVEATSYETAWAVAAGAMTCAAGLLLLGGRLVADRPATRPLPP